MRKKLLIAVAVMAAVLGGGLVLFLNGERPSIEMRFVQDTREQKAENIKQKEEVGLAEVRRPGSSALVSLPVHTYQTFNNCGPATLSMVLSFYGTRASQAELGNLMRPYQNPQGNNDDKTIFTSEFVRWAKSYGFEALSRRNGDIELLKTFTANGIPVVVKTWLRPNEDIGHFRVVRGFDEARGVIIQDDSYHGPNRAIPYDQSLSMWQPFNYDYMVVYSHEQKELVEAILAEEADERVAWENALRRAEKERELDPQNPYPVFNISVAAYHLGDYQRSVASFEEVEAKLPRRMLWYQIEPVQAYQKLGNYERVFAITDRILSRGNRAFSELYLVRGEAYLAQGQRERAREQFELALFYNKNFDSAREAFEGL